MPTASPGDAAPTPIADLQLRHDRRLSLAAFALLAGAGAWFARADWVEGIAQGRPLAGVDVATRFVLVVIPLIAFVMVPLVSTRRGYSILVAVATAALAAGYVWLNVLHPITALSPTRPTLFVLGVMYLALPNSLWRQIVPPILLTVGLIILVSLDPAAQPREIAGAIFMLTLFSGVGVLLVRRRVGLESDVEAAWASQYTAKRAADHALAELRTLRGIIPICSHCKRVKTEVGDWLQIEEYVREHSAADFSHGICPSCFVSHYGQGA